MRTMDVPEALASDLFSPESTMKPESQKMGSPAMNPVMVIARGAFALPVRPSM